jgi:hypothetical protein
MIVVSFRRGTATSFGDRRFQGWRCAHVFREQVSVLAHAIARPFDLHDDGVVKQAVEQRRGDDGISKDLAPFRKAAIRCEDHCALSRELKN